MKSNIRLASMFAVLACLSASVAFASGGTWTNVTVSLVEACDGYSGCGTSAVYVEFSANSTGGPGCATNKQWGIIDVSTTGGAFTATLAQTARLAGTTISVTGQGSCFDGGIYETIATITE